MTRLLVVPLMLAAVAAGALMLPGAWPLWLLVPLLAVIAVGAYLRTPTAPRHAAPPARLAPVSVTELWLYGPDSAAGSFDLRAELAWRRRFEIPPGLPVTGAEAGAGPPLAPRVPPFMQARERYGAELLGGQLERRATAADLEQAGRLEAQDREAAEFIGALGATVQQIRDAALAGLQ